MSTKPSKILTVALYAALGLGAAVLSVRFLLPWLAPMLLALCAAALLEPAVRALHARWRLSRGLAAGICVIVFLLAAFGLLYFLCGQLVKELSAFVQRLPEMLDRLALTLRQWEAALGKYTGDAPDGSSGWPGRFLSGITSRLSALPGELSAGLLRLLPAMASGAPSFLLFLVTAVLGTYFISASYPALMGFLRRQIPERFTERLRTARLGLRRTIGRWFRAQLIMMLITFVELTLGFLLLGVDYALLLALAVALIDALPVLGAGTVLIPWALYETLTGGVNLGVGLFIIYGAVTLLRNCIQAKLLGDQLGLHPVATLASIYAGWRIWGVLGMIIFPIAAISLVQLNASGLIRLWKTENEGENYGGDNIQHNRRYGDEYTGRHEYPPR